MFVLIGGHRYFFDVRIVKNKKLKKINFNIYYNLTLYLLP